MYEPRTEPIMELPFPLFAKLNESPEHPVPRRNHGAGTFPHHMLKTTPLEYSGQGVISLFQQGIIYSLS
jgi:hypothetical protein